MADVQFDEESQFQRNPELERKPLVIRLVLATGIVSTDRAAGYIVFVCVVIVVAFSAYFYSSSSAPAPKAPDGTQVFTAPGQPPRLLQPFGTR